MSETKASRKISPNAEAVQTKKRMGQLLPQCQGMNTLKVKLTVVLLLSILLTARFQWKYHWLVVGNEDTSLGNRGSSSNQTQATISSLKEQAIYPTIQEKKKLKKSSSLLANSTLMQTTTERKTRDPSNATKAVSSTAERPKPRLMPPQLVDLPPTPFYSGPFVNGKMTTRNGKNGTTATGNNGGGSGLRLHRIFYFGSFVHSQAFMQDWISATGVPYTRIEPMTGNYQHVCKQRRKDLGTVSSRKYCQESQRLGNTYRHMLRAADWMYDTTGTVLVVHDDTIHVDLQALDDFLTHNITKEMEAKEFNWNVLKLDCHHPNNNKTDTMTATTRPVWYPQPEVAHSEEEQLSQVECVQSNAILFRRRTLSRLVKERLWFEDDNRNRNNLQCMLGKKKWKFKTLCLDLGIVTTTTSTKEATSTTVAPTSKNNETASATSAQAGVVRNSWILNGQIGWSLEQIHVEGRRFLPSDGTDSPKPSFPKKIDRIYYHSLEKNWLRRQHMEYWLSQQQQSTSSSSSSIPYKRIEAKVGNASDVCIPAKNTPQRCRGMAGIAKTLTSIIDYENTTGISLVLEDDVIPLDVHEGTSHGKIDNKSITWLDRLMAALQYVPNDWDMIRLDCCYMRDFHLNYVNGFIADTGPNSPKDCAKKVGVCDAFCGGAYAMLWRSDGTSLQKLRQMWSQTPVDDADCIIGKTSFVQSYCVNIGIWQHYYIHSEFSDVSMLTN